MATDWVHIDTAHDMVRNVNAMKDKELELNREYIAVLKEAVNFWQSKYEEVVALASQEDES